MKETYLITPTKSINLIDQTHSIQKCKTRELRPNCSMFQLRKRLYITGGSEGKPLISQDDHYSINIEQEFEKLTPMLTSKFLHSMTGID